jgi:DNA-binding response OmpR family regulator
MTKLHAIVIDDTHANRNFLARLLVTANFDVVEAATGQEALNLMYVDSADIKLAVVDMQLPDVSGLQLTMRLRERFPDAMIVVATMHDDLSWIQNSFEAGADIYLVKPHGFMELFQRLTTHDLDELRAQGQNIIDQYGPRKYVPASVQT